MWFTRCFVLLNYGHDEKNIPCAGVSKVLMVLCETIISLYLLNRTIVLLPPGRSYHLKRADLLIDFVVFLVHLQEMLANSMLFPHICGAEKHVFLFKVGCSSGYLWCGAVQLHRHQ